MSATDVLQTPMPEAVIFDENTTSFVTPDAPTKPKTRPMNVKAVPFKMEEEDKLEDLFENEVQPSNDWKDPNDFLEAVFFNRHKNLIYKIYVDGTWESLRVAPDLLL